MAKIFLKNIPIDFYLTDHRVSHNNGIFATKFLRDVLSRKNFITWFTIPIVFRNSGTLFRSLIIKFKQWELQWKNMTLGYWSLINFWTPFSLPALVEHPSTPSPTSLLTFKLYISRVVDNIVLCYIFGFQFFKSNKG